MAFSHILLTAFALTIYLIVWREVERRIQAAPPLPVRGQATALGLLALEGLLLTLFAGLWFGSLGAGGAALLFLVVGALMEVAQVRQSPTGRRPWWSIAGGIVRIVIAGTILGRMLG